MYVCMYVCMNVCMYVCMYCVYMYVCMYVCIYVGMYISTYIKIQSVCLSVCSCFFAGLTAARINLIFGMHTIIWSDCAIGYIILTFEVIKGHFWSNKFLCKVPL